jgi:hypothetical protein
MVDISDNDHTSPIEFDLLSGPDSLDVMTISGAVSFYPGFKFP